MRRNPQSGWRRIIVTNHHTDLINDNYVDLLYLRKWSSSDTHKLLIDWVNCLLSDETLTPIFRWEYHHVWSNTYFVLFDEISKIFINIWSQFETETQTVTSSSRQPNLSLRSDHTERRLVDWRQYWELGPGCPPFFRFPTSSETSSHSFDEERVFLQIKKDKIENWSHRDSWSYVDK